MKKWAYVIGTLALGFVIFNNIVQTVEAIKITKPLRFVGFVVAGRNLQNNTLLKAGDFSRALNSDYMTGLAIAMITSLA